MVLVQTQRSQRFLMTRAVVESPRVELQLPWGLLSLGLALIGKDYRIVLFSLVRSLGYSVVRQPTRFAYVLLV